MYYPEGTRYEQVDATDPVVPVHQNSQGDGINPVVLFTKTPGRKGSVPSDWYSWS